MLVFTVMFLVFRRAEISRKENIIYWKYKYILLIKYYQQFNILFIIFPNFYKNKSIKDFKLEFGIFNLKIYIKF